MLLPPPHFLLNPPLRKNAKKTWNEITNYLNFVVFIISKHGARTCKVSRQNSNVFLSYSAKTKRGRQTDGQIVLKK